MRSAADSRGSSSPSVSSLSAARLGPAFALGGRLCLVRSLAGLLVEGRSLLTDDWCSFAGAATQKRWSRVFSGQNRRDPSVSLPHTARKPVAGRRFGEGGGFVSMFPLVATKRQISSAAAERKRQREAEEAAAACRQRARDRAADDEAPRRMGQVRGGKG